MAFKDYGFSALQNINVVNTPVGEGSPSFSNNGFSLTISENLNDSPATSANDWGGSSEITADIDYQQAGNALPLTAQITKIVITQVLSLLSNVNANGTDNIAGGSGDCETAVGVSWNTFDSAFPIPSTVSTSDSDSDASPPNQSSVNVSCSSSVNLNPATFEIDFSTDPDWLILFPAGYLTYAEFVTLFQGFLVSAGFSSAISIVCSDPGSYGGVANLTLSSFNLQVFFTPAGGFSYYIKPTEIIANGQPVSIIASAEDIVEVLDGETPPEGFVFYGTSETYPDGPILLWWVTNDQYIFYIESPISPGPGWVSQVDPPSCPGCLTMSLGTLEVLLANASGIYQLELDKTSDTLYDRASEDTVEFKIVNPSIKTAFIP